MSHGDGRDPSGTGLSRRRFFQAGLAVYAAAAAASDADADGPASVKPFELDEIGIAELQEGMASGKYTARSLVERYTARIEEIDRRGPAVNSVIELNPDALEIADALDKERKDERASRPAARHPGAHQGQHRHGGPHGTPPPARWRWWAPGRRRTRSSWSACARPGR